jgi:hypothetical protein
MAFKFSCEHCKAIIVVKYLGTGDIVKCPHCNNTMAVPQDKILTDVPSNVLTTVMDPEIAPTVGSSSVGINSIDHSEARFKTLLGYGEFLSVLGWIVLGIAGLLILVGLVTINDNGSFLGRSVYGLISLGALSILIGIILLIWGQIITCFVSIEANTRATNEILEKRLKSLELVK